MRVQLLRFIIIAGTIVGLATNASAQPALGASYVSQIDRELTIRKVAVLPVTDNVEGIYARPIEAQLIASLRESHRWDVVEATLAGAAPTPSELEEDVSAVARIAKSIDADAIFVASASRGPKGLSIKLDLFLLHDGKLLAQEVLRDHPRFEIPEVRDQVKRMYRQVTSKLPYDGLILSRQGNRVTINLGKSDGFTKDQVVTAIQIISINRHPKFNFIVSSEKEIIGKIKILKVEETLSFGVIVSEKERGAIQRLAKIAGLTEVEYAEPDSLSPGSGDSVASRPDAKIAFGKEAREWVPVRAPTFGLVEARVGLGMFSNSAAISSGAVEASSNLYPSLNVAGELWLNPEWTVRAELSQGVVSTSNPRAGSSPEKLNHLVSRYAINGTYNFLLRDDFFGPKMMVSLGLANYRLYVDSSTPVAFTTTNFSGLVLGLGAIFPLFDEKIWYAGGQFNFYLMPTLGESPQTSGASSTPTINEFYLYAQKKIAENIRATAGLTFAAYASTFSGQGSRVDGNGNQETASSLSQKHTIASVGMMYMF